ncbi:MAG: NADH-quinone oxidoreductase subunit N [Actinomycetota bacterium]|nr:NADH-quinone oxidoreductase subunit N [Actinomycetota bacterium]
MGFVRPGVDWHALAPEVVLVGTIVVLLLVDVASGDRAKWAMSSVAGIGLLASLLPLLTLAVNGHDRSMFGGAYVVDNFALLMKAVFIVAGYLTVLLSTNHVAEGDYWEGEYYLLLVSSVFGMTFIASARDLISLFVALEMLSIPAYLLAGWRKRELTGNEAGLKYYLMGVFASAVMLYGMSLIYGGTNTTVLVQIGARMNGSFGNSPVAALGIVFVLVGFAFKVSAVPFHNWAPDTYEGAPTPVTAFLSVASKAAGFVAMLELIFIAFYGRDDVFGPMIWILAALTMTVGNLIALRQTNVVRLLAYSSVAQAGFMLAPLAVAGHSGAVGRDALIAVISYLVIYTAMNMGAFGVVLAVSKKTRSGEINSWSGLVQYAPGLAVSMAMFLFALAGIPPLGGWFAKFQVFKAVLGTGTFSGAALGVVVAVNSVIALFYYANLVRIMFMEDAPDGDLTPVKVPVAITAAIAIAVVSTLVIGFAPGLIGRLAEHATFAIGR